MPLSEFVRYLNAQLPLPSRALRIATPFVSEAGRVLVHFGDWRLASGFQPIIDASSGDVVGHSAQLVASTGEHHAPVSAADVFAMPRDSDELVFLDRLVRTLHTLNYLVFPRRKQGGLLLLKVHPRHVQSVPADHGMAFEEILRSCGLLPSHITLEIELPDHASLAHVTWAIDNYKRRGYGVVLSGNGVVGLDADSIERITPTFIRLNGNASWAAWHNQSAGLLQRIGTRTLIARPAQAAKYVLDDHSRVDLLEVSEVGAVPELALVDAYDGATVLQPALASSRGAAEPVRKRA